jgi:uncharacterized membrane protein YphA (DoxX/SURF4 family)
MAAALLSLGLVARFGVGLILVLAGVAKLLAGRQVVERLVSGYGIVPERAAPWTARALPVVEISVGAWLLVGLFIQAAAAAGMVLLVGLSAAVAQALLRGLVLPCGCFGGADPARSISWRIVVRNASMVAGLALLVVGQR